MAEVYHRNRSRPERVETDQTDVDDLPMLGSNYESSSATIELTQVNIDVQPERRKKEVLYSEQHEHLLRSGPLGRCNDPFCTTCPSYVHIQQKQKSLLMGTALMQGAKDFRSMCWGNLMSFIPGIINPHTKLIQWWNKFFVISCLVAIFVDPLFFFLLAAEPENKCIYIDRTFAMAVTVLRSFTDFFYFLHMLLQFRVAYVESREKIGAGELVDNPRKIAVNYLRRWFVIDIFAVLPLPQVMIWVIVPKSLGKADNAKNLLRVTVLVQYIPRFIRFLPLLSGDSSVGFIFETAWANFVINLLMYLLAGHVVGSSWYLLGLQRVNECLHRQCRKEDDCKFEYLDCGYGAIDLAEQPDRKAWLRSGNQTAKCFDPNTEVFAYGIYTNAVLVVTQDHAVPKYLYSLFWGFQQISTLAGNQEPSLFVGEVLFILAVTGLGLLLFALLIGNMQNFLQSLSRRKLEMQLRRHDAESWMARRKLPIELRRRVRQAERLQWASTRGVNEEEFLRSLPEDLHKQIRRFLCFDLLKEVGIFKHMQDFVLDAICEHLQPKVYTQGSVIMRMNSPLERMIFIVRGNVISCGEDEHEVELREGDFCGEELLVWCLEHSSSQPALAEVPGRRRAIPTKRTGQHAMSSRKVECFTNVEAFTIDAADLDKLVKNYSRYMRNPHVQGAIRYASPYWRSWAAQCIQVAWRYRRRKLYASDSASGENGGSLYWT